MRMYPERHMTHDDAEDNTDPRPTRDDLVFLSFSPYGNPGTDRQGCAQPMCVR